MQTNPYEPPASTNIEVNNHAETDSSGDERRSIVVRILSAAGLMIVIIYESWDAVTHSIQWRDSVHVICVAATIYFLFSAFRSGHWRSRR
jgi:hypothetical protein